MVQVSKQSFSGTFIVTETHFRTLRARGAQNRKFVFCQNQLFEVIYKSLYRSKTQNGRFLVLYIVTETHFRALRARGAREQKTPSHEFFL